MRKNSPAKMIIFPIVGIMALTWGILLAAEPATDQPISADSTPPEANSSQPPIQSPLMQEITQVMADQQIEMSRLEAAFTLASSNAEALLIQRQMQDLAIQTEVAVMEVQVRHLRLAGQEDEAVALETALSEMTAPKPPRIPVDRSSSSATSTDGR